MLGWCTICDQLKSIVKLGLKLGSRECEYGPVDHDTPTTHRGCGGVVYEIDGPGSALELACERCEQVVMPEQVALGGEHCRGSRRPIR